MLKQRPAGDKSWPIACSDTTLGTADEELDLSGAHLSYGDFEGATLTGAGAIKLNGAGLAHADLSDSKLTASLSNGKALIDFTAANLTSADLSGSKITAQGSYYGPSTIDFTEATLAKADLSGSELTANSIIGLPSSDYDYSYSGYNCPCSDIVLAGATYPQLDGVYSLIENPENGLNSGKPV